MELVQGSYTGVFARGEGDGEFEVVVGVETGGRDDVEFGKDIC